MLSMQVTGNADAAAQYLLDQSAAMMQSLWKINVVDIENTLEVPSAASRFLSPASGLCFRSPASGQSALPIHAPLCRSFLPHGFSWQLPSRRQVVLAAAVSFTSCSMAPLLECRRQTGCAVHRRQQPQA